MDSAALELAENACTLAGVGCRSKHSDGLGPKTSKAIATVESTLGPTSSFPKIFGEDPRIGRLIRKDLNARDCEKFTSIRHDTECSFPMKKWSSARQRTEDIGFTSGGDAAFGAGSN